MTINKILAGATLALGLATGAFADGHEKTKVGFVYVGPVGDGGWTYEHDQGRLAVEEHFGDAVLPRRLGTWTRPSTWRASFQT